MRAALLIALVLCLPAHAALLALDPNSALIETRYCGAPKRDFNGVIIRDPKVIYAFRKANWCPTTQKYGMGACPGWSLNHPVPLACGGCDAVSNLVWMRNDAKKIVDSYERKISASTPPQPDTAACVNKVLP